MNISPVIQVLSQLHINIIPTASLTKIFTTTGTDSAISILLLMPEFMKSLMEKNVKLAQNKVFSVEVDANEVVF